MFRKTAVRLLVTATMTISSVTILVPVAVAQQSAFEAKCAVTAGTNGGQKFVTIKCHKVSEPGNYKIRTTLWENQNEKDYRGLMRMAGKRFTCTMVWGGANSSREAINTNYEITDCRR